MYGVLYNWYAALDGSAGSSSNPSGVKGCCPNGWHIPSDAEWTVLSDYLTNNGFGYEGSGSDIAKSLAAISNWKTSLTPGTPGYDQATNNISGFSGLPGGGRLSSNGFYDITDYGNWWTSTATSSFRAYNRTLLYNSSSFKMEDDYKWKGYSIRCVKD